MYLMTNLDTYNYKYLSKEDKAVVDGIHFALEELYNVKNDDTEMEDRTADAFEDNDEDPGISSDDMMTIWNASSDAAIERLEHFITELIVSRIDEYNDFEKHKKETDERYAKLKIVPDMTLYDTEGYLFGTVKSVDGDRAIIVLAEPGDSQETEREMSLSDIRKLTIVNPSPMSTEYRDGKEIKHFRYGGGIVTEIKKL